MIFWRTCCFSFLLMLPLIGDLLAYCFILSWTGNWIPSGMLRKFVNDFVFLLPPLLAPPPEPERLSWNLCFGKNGDYVYCKLLFNESLTPLKLLSDSLLPFSFLFSVFFFNFYVLFILYSFNLGLTFSPSLLLAVLSIPVESLDFKNWRDIYYVDRVKLFYFQSILDYFRGFERFWKSCCLYSSSFCLSLLVKSGPT